MTEPTRDPAGVADQRAPLGFLSLLALGINGIVGVGIFFAPSAVAGHVPGRAGIAVYALTAMLLIPIALAYAKLGGRFREDGGPYVWARAAFGPTAGFAVGWIAFVSALFSTSAVVAGLAQHAGPLVGLSGEVGRRVFAAIAVLGLGAVAASGLRPSAWVWSGVTVLKLLPLLLIAILFFFVSVPVPATESAPITIEHAARAALVVVFATQGFEIVPVPAGHARGSRKSVPFATVGSLLVAALLYVVLQAACVASVPNLAQSEAPLVDASRSLGGANSATIVALGTNVSALGIAFGMFAMTPRYLAALGRTDGLGSWLGKEDGRKVPQRALWLTVLVVLGLVLSGKLMELFVLSSVAVVAQYGVSAASLAVLAFRRVAGLVPFDAWPAPLAAGAVILVGRAGTRTELGVAAAVLALGGVLFVVRRAFASP